MTAEIVTNCSVCGKSLTEEQNRSPNPEVYGDQASELDFCFLHYIENGYMDGTVKMTVVPAKGITYHRIVLDFELPEEFGDWTLVPVWNHGKETFFWENILHVNLRKPKEKGGSKNG